MLTKDPNSILAACCRIDGPLKKGDVDDAFFFNRDWWLFRHILSFLRSGVLPCEVEILKELYLEASYYRLEIMQKAIENIPLHEIIKTGKSIALFQTETDR